MTALLDERLRDLATQTHLLETFRIYDNTGILPETENR